MKKFSKLPLYLGLSVLVMSVLISVIKVGQTGNLTSQRTKAAVSGSSLELKFTSPNTVNVLFNSDKAIKGADAVIKYDKNKFRILSSTLRSGPSFITTGGVIDEALGTFSFSALATKDVLAGIIANFKVVTSGNLQQANGELTIQEGRGGSAVFDAKTVQNILNKTTGVKVNVVSK